MNAMLNNVKIFGYFLLRDWYVYKKIASRIIINYAIISPIVFAIVGGYIIPNTSITKITPEKATIFFIGSVIWNMFPMAFVLMLDFLADMEHERFVQYQISILPPWIVLFEKTLFTTLVLFISLLSYFPIATLLLGSYFYHEHMNWPAMMVILFLGSLFCSAFNLFFACFVDGFSKLNNFFARYNIPMINFGGMVIPWFIMAQYSSTLGWLALCNPIIYITEGLKRTIVGGPHFLSFFTCVIALLGFSLLFFFIACRYFKRKLDHI